MDDDDSGQNFTADMVMTRVSEADVFRNDGSDEITLPLFVNVSNIDFIPTSEPAHKNI